MISFPLLSGRLLLLALLFFCSTTTITNAQRLKRGCYDAHKETLRCDSSLPLLSTTTNSSSSSSSSSSSHQYPAWESTCRTLAVDVFPTDAVVWNPSSHADFLNGIEADSDLCQNLLEAYPHCLFCAATENANIRFDCQDDARVTVCGGHASVQDILNEHKDLFPNGQSDIDAACHALEESYQYVWVRDFNYALPTTIDLCQRQALVKHLCPGYCEGTCFAQLPSCNDTHNNPTDPNLDLFGICEQINFQAFYEVDIGQVMTLENHVDYLRVIDNNTQFCSDARQAYPHCYWCQTDRCFDHETWPTSCEGPDDDGTIDPTIDVQAVCKQLTYAFDNVAFEDEMNISAHKFLVPADLEFCDQARQVYHLCYWCAGEDAPGDFCLPGTACSSNITLPQDFESYTLRFMGLRFGPEDEDEQKQHCEDVHQTWAKYWDDPFSLQHCYEDIYLARLCPVQFCEAQAEEASFAYLGASTTAQKRALIWLSRVAAILSFVGASYIIYDTARDPNARVLVYHQLLVGMAIFDIITAFAWVFATAPIDASGIASQIEGAIGNHATCKAQGFFVQLGFTSIFYNVSLSIYYVMVIVYDWREFQLSQLRIYLHLVPVLLGAVLAFIGLGQYDYLVYGCHLQPANDGELWPVLVLVVLPLGISILVITASMLVVYCKVRYRANRSKQWALGVSQASRIEQAVFRQCVSYVLAFYITWPILFSVYLASVDEEGPLGLSLIVAFVAPLQGFNNFLVYVRPKLNKSSKPNSSGEESPVSKGHKSLRNMLRWLPSSTLFTSSNADASTRSSRPFNLFDAGACPAVLDQPSAAIALQSTENAEQPWCNNLSIIPEIESRLERNTESCFSKSGADFSSTNDHSVVVPSNEFCSGVGTSIVMPEVNEEGEDESEGSKSQAAGRIPTSHVSEKAEEAVPSTDQMERGKDYP